VCLLACTEGYYLKYDNNKDNTKANENDPTPNPYDLICSVCLATCKSCNDETQCTSCWEIDDFDKAVLLPSPMTWNAARLYMDNTGTAIANGVIGISYIEPFEPLNKNQHMCVMRCQDGYFLRLGVDKDDDGVSTFDAYGPNPGNYLSESEKQSCQKCSNNCRKCNIEYANCTDCWEPDDIDLPNWIAAPDYPMANIKFRNVLNPFKRIEVTHWKEGEQPKSTHTDCGKTIEANGQNGKKHHACELQCSLGYYLKSEMTTSTYSLVYRSTEDFGDFLRQKCVACGLTCKECAGKPTQCTKCWSWADLVAQYGPGDGELIAQDRLVQGDLTGVVKE
jgi:hypothetical protein